MPSGPRQPHRRNAVVRAVSADEGHPPGPHGHDVGADTGRNGTTTPVGDPARTPHPSPATGPASSLPAPSPHSSGRSRRRRPRGPSRVRSARAARPESRAATVAAPHPPAPDPHLHGPRPPRSPRSGAEEKGGSHSTRTAGGEPVRDHGKRADGRTAAASGCLRPHHPNSGQPRAGPDPGMRCWSHQTATATAFTARGLFGNRETT